ncbi:MAG: hypothetical protein EYC69_04855 [Bacteroidetes bacterium]|nr:MAG: hypothetical protein EYC69_04855 [Bacteroidota bacterium]
MKFEKYLFYLLVLVHLLPVLMLPYFVTHDGPAHVYNANLIHRMLFDQNPGGFEFFHFNPQILPNWISHVLLGVFNLIMDAALSERLLLAIYFVSFPLAFRALILSVNPNGFAGTYLIFPYIQAFSILTGLFSFCLGLSVLFYVLYLWQKSEPDGTPKKYFWFSVWMILIYFSHLFVFILAILSLGVLISWNHLLKHQKSIKKSLSGISLWWKEIRWLLSVSVIPILLTLVFAYNQASKTDTEAPDFNTLLQLFIDVRPIISLNYELEKVYSKPLFFVYLIMIVAAIIRRVLRSRKEKMPASADAWFILFCLMTFFYFILPDDIFSGGIVAIRFSLMSYLFLIVWIVAYAPPRFIAVGSLLSVLASILLLVQRFPALKSLSDDAADYATCAEKIDEGSNLLTLNYSDNWMLDNVSSYIAGDRNIILLDNYEAKQAHFPIMWKENRSPESTGLIAGGRSRPCLDLNKYKAKTSLDIDYILVMKRPHELNDSCTVLVDQQLKAFYKEVFVTPKQKGVLYKRMIEE